MSQFDVDEVLEHSRHDPDGTLTRYSILKSGGDLHVTTGVTKPDGSVPDISTQLIHVPNGFEVLKGGDSVEVVVKRGLLRLFFGLPAKRVRL